MRRQPIRDASRYPRPYGELVLLAGNTPSMMRTERADLKLLHLNPGGSTSLHRHLLAESLYHVLEGELTFTDGAGVTVKLEMGDTFIVDPGEPHRLINVGSTLAVVLEVESPPHDSDDKLVMGNPPPQKTCVHPGGRFWSEEPKVRIKICGIRGLDGAWACTEAGVDAIGVPLRWAGTSQTRRLACGLDTPRTSRGFSLSAYGRARSGGGCHACQPDWCRHSTASGEEGGSPRCCSSGLRRCPRAGVAPGQESCAGRGKYRGVNSSRARILSPH